jgi:hypothetical protein
VDFDGDHMRAGGLDRLVEVYPALVDLQAASLLDRVDDVLRRDRAEQAAVGARRLTQRQDGLAEDLGVLRSLLGGLADGALSGLLPALGVGHGGGGSRLRELARDEVVAQIPG